MMLQSQHDKADGVEQCHLRFWEFHFLNQCHQSIKHNLRVWQEEFGLELPLIRNSVELPPGRYPNNLVVETVGFVQQVLEDLVDNRLLLLGHLDSDPLRDDDCDATANDVEAW